MRWLPLISLTLSGCLLGEAWPDLYAEAFCQSAYACVGAEEVEAAAGYVDEASCRELTRAVVEADPKHQGFQNGDCKWNAENARACLDELAEIQQDEACDGDMPFAAFALDAVSPACALVYDDCL